MFVKICLDACELSAVTSLEDPLLCLLLLVAGVVLRLMTTSGGSQWDKVAKGAACMVSNPAGVVKRRVVKDLGGGRIIDDMIVGSHTHPNKFHAPLRGAKDIDVVVAVVPLDDLEGQVEDDWGIKKWSLAMPRDTGRSLRY